MALIVTGFAGMCCNICRWNLRWKRKNWSVFHWKEALDECWKSRICAAGVDGTPILNGLTLAIQLGEVQAIMGPNGSGKSTLSYVLSGKDGYEVSGGDMLFDGRSLADMAPEERAIAGLFLAFQYPLEIPGVTNMTLLKTSLNAILRGRGEDEMDAASFLRLAREKSRGLGMNDDMLKRQLNVGFSGGEKKRNEILQMAMLEPKLAILTKPIAALILMR